VKVRRLHDRPPTAIQRHTCAVLDALQEARLEPGREQYDVVLDIVGCRIAHDVLAWRQDLRRRFGLGEQRTAA
jgi:hypothetical protein